MPPVLGASSELQWHMRTLEPRLRTTVVPTMSGHRTAPRPSLESRMGTKWAPPWALVVFIETKPRLRGAFLMGGLGSNQ